MINKGKSLVSVLMNSHQLFLTNPTMTRYISVPVRSPIDGLSIYALKTVLKEVSNELNLRQQGLDRNF